MGKIEEIKIMVGPYLLKHYEIESWMFSMGMTYLRDQRVINPVTYESQYSYQLKTEEDKIIFVLKWGNE